MGEFQEFTKIYRWTREIVITEKIDGTNAQVLVVAQGEAPSDDLRIAVVDVAGVPHHVYAGSRNRYITPASDNFGFAGWVKAHAEELATGVGEGRHYGEWWGAGIQRRYDIGEKRFSLFNVSRWNEATPPPACCHIVPVLYRGLNAPGTVEASVENLAQTGSHAAPGFMDPEGVVVFHVPSGHMFKKTIKKDEEPKGRTT